MKNMRIKTKPEKKKLEEKVLQSIKERLWSKSPGENSILLGRKVQVTLSHLFLFSLSHTAL